MADTDRIDELIRITARIEAIVDRLDTKIDSNVETLARHDIRITMVEKAGQHAWERFALWIGIAFAVITTVVSDMLG